MLDQHWHCRRSPREAVDYQNRIGRVDEKARKFIDRCGFSLRRSGHSQLGNRYFGFVLDGAFLQSGIQDENNGRHWWSERETLGNRALLGN